MADYISQPEQENADLQDALDSINDILNPAEGDGDDDDGEVDDDQD